MLITLPAFFKKISKTGYLVALIALLIRTGFFMTLPFLAVYLTRDGIFTPSQIGIVIGISGLVFSLTSLFNGLYVDRRSQRNILIISLILSGFCYFGLALSIKVFFALFFVNAVLGWLRSLADMSAVALLVANINKEHLSYAYSLRFMAINLGLVFGPLIGAGLVSRQSLLIFYIAGSIHIAVGTALLFFGKNQLKQAASENTTNVLQNFHILRKDKILMNLTLINFIMLVTYSQFDSTIPQYITQTTKNPAFLVTIILITNAAVCVLFQAVILHWAERTSLKISGIIGSLLFSATFILIAFYPSPVSWVLTAILLSLGELFTLPINGLLAMRIAPKHLVASYNGLINFGLLGASIGPIIGGYGLQYVGSKYLFLGLALSLLIVVWRYLAAIPD